MSDYSMYVPQVHFELIPIKDLVSNQDYQRNLSISHIEKAAENFDLNQINPVKVSKRDGINYVFNGQHTIEIVALVSGSRETPVWCMVYDDLEYQNEADIFANQQKFVKPLLPYEIFMAHLEAGSHQQLLIRDLVESYNLTIGLTKAPGVICAISSLESIYTKYGYQTLNRTLRLVIAAWEGDVNSLSANVLRAVAKLINTYRDRLDDEIFKEKLGAVSIKTIARTAKERRSGTLGYAEAMVIIYNGKKKSDLFRLPIGMLYAKGYDAEGLDDEDEENHYSPSFNPDDDTEKEDVTTEDVDEIDEGDADEDDEDDADAIEPSFPFQSSIDDL